MLYRGSISWLHQHVSIVKHYYDYDVEAAKAFEHTVTHNSTSTVFHSKKEIVTIVFNNNHYICSRKQDIDLGTVCPLFLPLNMSHQKNIHMKCSQLIRLGKHLKWLHHLSLILNPRMPPKTHHKPTEVNKSEHV